jgi:hypothetical protein
MKMEGMIDKEMLSLLQSIEMHLCLMLELDIDYLEITVFV